MSTSRLRKLAGDQSGFSLVFVGFGCMAFVAASMLAIDVGMLMTARSQAQNAADAGALAGATALAFESWTDRSATGPAVVSAIATSKANQVMSADVEVTPADVEFFNDPAGEANRWVTSTNSRPPASAMGAGVVICQNDSPSGLIASVIIC